uniref:Glucuronosyltransferase n=1 Tax=Opuntia streptacantha TaxID=393608 RepID=A0A7C8YLK6_OPUST
MKKTQFYSLINKKWRMRMLGISIFSILLIFSLVLLHSRSSTSDSDQTSILSRRSIPPESGLPKLPRFAYLISGTRGEVPQIKRLFQAVYHPRNYYVLHLDLDASDEERLKLAKFVKSTMAVRHFRNAMVVGKADLITYKGPTAITATLHAAAILLKQSET